MVPEGWDIATVSHLIKTKDIIGVQDGNHGNDHPKASDYVESGIPFVMARDLKQGAVNTKTCSFIKKEQADSLRIGFAKPGDVLLSHKGTIGATAIVPEGYEYIMLTPQVTYYRVNKNGRLDKDYLYQYFNGAEYQEKLNNLASQSTRNYLGITAQKELLIKLPPLQEQKKIAKILSNWDKAITTTEQLLANSQQQKKAVMQQLLTGKKRLLDKSGIRFSGEWKSHHLADVARVVMGSSPKSEAYNETNEGLPLIQGNADIKNRKSCPRIYTAEVTKECSPGDILLSVRAPVGLIAKSYHNACIGRGIAAIRAENDVWQEFLYQLLLWFEPRWLSFSQGSTFDSINSDDIRMLRVRLPSFTEQQKIVAVLSAADKEIDALQQSLDCLKQEKKALMQQLLTGKRRVIVGEMDDYSN